jgi:6-phosphogluconate dehydrogenase
VNEQAHPGQQLEVGMVGLGVMGRNLSLNMAEHGHSVAGFDTDAAKAAALGREAGALDARGSKDITEFVALPAALWAEPQPGLLRSILQAR